MKKKSFFEHRGYLGYLSSQLFGGGFLAFYGSVLAWVRPTLWLRRILRLLVSLAYLLESGVLLLLLSLAALFFVPLSLILLFVLLPVLLRARARACARLVPSLSDRRVVLLLHEDGRLAARLISDGYAVLRICKRGAVLHPLRVSAGGVTELSPRLWFSLQGRISEAASRVICIENLQNTLAGERRGVL